MAVLETVAQEKNLSKFIKEFLRLLVEHRPAYRTGKHGREGAWTRATITDIYRACLHFFPEVTIQEVYNALYEWMPSTKVASFVCGDIYKRIYYYNSAIITDPPVIKYFSVKLGAENLDEFGVKVCELVQPERCDWGMTGYYEVVIISI